MIQERIESNPYLPADHCNVKCTYTQINIYYKHVSIFMQLRKGFDMKSPVHREFNFPLSFPIVCPLSPSSGGVQHLAEMFQTAE